MDKIPEFWGHKAVFAFRVDLDYFHPKHVMETLRVSERHNIRMTWFVNMETSRFHKKELRRIGETQDVQNHAFLHKTFDNGGRNFENIMKADSVLKGFGFGCKGFAAPFGYWNEGLGKALEKTGYLYSSEFREGKGIFPFCHDLGGRKAKVLQVPVHPICLGTLLEKGYSPKEAIAYFEKVIDFFYGNRIPIFLYGHPTGRLGKYPEVLDAIFEKVKALEDVWITDYSFYADFWKKKGFGERPVEWENHNIFLEERLSLARRLKGLQQGQVLRVEKKKIDRRLHK